MGDVSVRWIDEGGTFNSGGIEGLERLPSGAIAWVDVFAPDESTLASLERRFSLHPLVVEDALHAQLRPKIDLYPEGAFIAWLTPWLDDSGALNVHELDCFVRNTLILTLHRQPLAAIDETAELAEDLLKRGPDWVLHAILDRLVDSVLPVADAIGEQFQVIEDRMLDSPDRSDLEALHSLRMQVLAIHRIIAPERDMVLELSRERAHVSEDTYRYFSDVVDHLLRVQESLEMLREIGSAVMDIYLSAQSNRLNEIMKVLTVVTVVLGALTAISGIYGMNLLGGMWPPSEAQWSFGVVIAAMLAVAAVMSLFFRRKNWW